MRAADSRAPLPEPGVRWWGRRPECRLACGLIHGAGGSCGDFELAAPALARHVPNVFAFDLHGHGARSGPTDLGHERLVADGAAVVASAAALAGAESVVLVGHSLGACIAVRIAAEIEGSHEGLKVAAVVTAEMVESAAAAGIGRMREALGRRPRTFATRAQAAEWMLRAGMVRSPEAASAAAASMLRSKSAPPAASVPQAAAATSAAAEKDEAAVAPASMSGAVAAGASSGGAPKRPVAPSGGAGSSPPGPGLARQASQTAAPRSAGPVEWRVDLLASAPLWEGWLAGHTARFLGLRAPRLLLLSATENTDADLLRAQMQGQFAVRTMPFAGHFVHLDAPGPFVQCVVEFLARSGVIEAGRAAGCAWEDVRLGAAPPSLSAVGTDLRACRSPSMPPGVE